MYAILFLVVNAKMIFLPIYASSRASGFNDITTQRSLIPKRRYSVRHNVFYTALEQLLKRYDIKSTFPCALQLETSSDVGRSDD